jgi:hypothetical protein
MKNKKDELLKKLREYKPIPFNPPTGKCDTVYINGLKELENQNPENLTQESSKASTS